MISKISFSKCLRQEMRQLNWLTALQLLVFGLMLPFRVLMVLASDFWKYSDGPTPATLFQNNVGLGHAENTCVILAAAAICALSAFSYLYSPEKQDFYHSLPMKRERLFAVKCAGSFLTFALPYLLCQLLSLLIGFFYRAASIEMAWEILYASVQGILFFLCGYSGVLIAIMLTGKLLLTLLAIGVFLIYGPMLWILQTYLSADFFFTRIGDWISQSSLGFSSPWAYCVRTTLESGLSGKASLPDAAGLCKLLAIAAVLTAAALALYHIRKGEAAGRPLAFEKTEPVIKLLITVPTALYAGLVALDFFQSSVWEAVFLLFFGTLACVIMEFIYRVDIRQALGHRIPIAATAVIACLIFFPLRFDLFGYNTYIPEQSDLVSMSVIPYDNYMDYPEEDGTIDQREPQKTKLDHSETTDFGPLYELALDGVDHAARENDGDDNVRGIQVKYRTREGKEVYRGYVVSADLYKEKMNEMMQSEEFRRAYFPILTWNEAYTQHITGITADLFQMEDFSWFDVSETEAEEMQTIEIRVPVSRLQELSDAYRRDLEHVTFSDLMQASGTLSFDTDQSGSDFYSISSAFTETMAVVKDVYDTTKEYEIAVG